MSPSVLALEYANAVVSGTVPACKWVRLAGQRFLDNLAVEGTDDFPYIFDQARADRAVDFMQKMPHIKGKWAAKKEKLTFTGWECFIECNLFGWVHRDTGLRRFRKSYERIPRKNGKSTRVAARGIFMFCADGETGAEIYSGATSEKQALEVFRPAWAMVQKLPALRARYGVEQAGNAKNPGAMYKAEDMSKFELLIGKPGDGASPHMAIIDEYHEHDTDHMLEAMETGMGAREQPLLSIITTSGSNLAGPCYEMDMEMQALLEGRNVNETVFCIMYGIDEDDDWQDEKSLIKANPNYNISVFAAFLQAQLVEARLIARKQNAFLTKHLNEWVGAKTAWMNMLVWQRQAKRMTMDEFKAWPCHVSCDLASKKDVAAVDVTFKRDGQFYSFKKFFVPEEALEENDKYQEFVAAGVLEVTDGAMIDQERIEEYIRELKINFEVIDYAFDDWQADYMMTRLSKLKIEVIRYPFKGKAVSEPMKLLESLILDKKYWHDGNPMQTWMMANVTAKEDTRGNIFPNKARRNDHRCKIDGVAVAIMSIGRWFAEDEPPKEYKMFFVGGPG